MCHVLNGIGVEEISRHYSPTMILRIGYRYKRIQKTDLVFNLWTELKPTEIQVATKTSAYKRIEWLVQDEFLFWCSRC